MIFTLAAAGVDAHRQPHNDRQLASSTGAERQRAPIATSASAPHAGRGRDNYWHERFLQMRHVAYTRGVEARRLARKLRVKWQPTVDYALTLAASVSGVPRGDLAAVSHCESTWNPFAKNGRQLGLFQLGWRPFGLDPYDPIANALSAALTVVHDGGWRQWVCKP